MTHSTGRHPILITAFLPGSGISRWHSHLLGRVAEIDSVHLRCVFEQDCHDRKGVHHVFLGVARLWDAAASRLSRRRVPNALASVDPNSLQQWSAAHVAELPGDLVIDLRPSTRRVCSPVPWTPRLGIWRLLFGLAEEGESERLVGLRQTLAGVAATPYRVCVEGWGHPGPPAPYFERHGSRWLRPALVDAHAQSFSHNRSEVLWHAAALLPQIIAATVRDQGMKEQPAESKDALAGTVHLGRPPGTTLGRQSLRLPIPLLFVSHAARTARLLANRAIEREHWVLLWDEHDPTGPVRTLPARRLDPPPDRFWADPHLLHDGEVDHLFIEEVPYATFRGHIAVMSRLEGGDWGPSRVVLADGIHLSYPAVFRVAGELYMIPETIAAEEIRLYRCAGPIEEWRLERVLIHGLRAADTTLVEHGGLWWLFAAVAHFPWALPNSELHIFWSDDPIHGEWHPHVANPVCIDAGSARPAGPFLRQGARLLRPAQDCRQGYGWRVRLMEVLHLDRQMYVEREIATYVPDPRRQVFATHSLTVCAGIRVQDGRTVLRKSQVRRSATHTQREVARTRQRSGGSLRNDSKHPTHI